MTAGNGFLATALCTNSYQDGHCPCMLASIRACLPCSMLQGEDSCDCDWIGACPYRELRWKDPHQLPLPPAGDSPRLIQGFSLAPCTSMAFFQVAPDLFSELAILETLLIGVHLPPNHSLLKGSIISLYPAHNIAAVGMHMSAPGQHRDWQNPATHSLLHHKQAAVMGLSPLLEHRQGHILILASSSFGSLLALPVVTALHRENKITVLAAPGSHVISRQLRALGATVKPFPFSSRDLLTEMRSQSFSYLCNLGSADEQKWLVQAMQARNLNLPLAALDTGFFHEL